MAHRAGPEAPSPQNDDEAGSALVLPVQTRDFRQNFKANMDEVTAHRRLLAIHRGEEAIGYVVPVSIGALLTGLPAVRDLAGLQRWLIALRDQPIGGEHLIHNAVIAHLDYVKGHGVKDALTLSQMETCLPASRDGRTVALQFGQPGLISRGMVTVLEDGQGHWLQGSFEVVDPERLVWLELPDGQVIDGFERHGRTYILPPTPIGAEVELMFAWLHYGARAAPEG